MKFKPSELNLHTESNAPDSSDELSLYADLLAFSELSPEEQSAQLSQQSSIEIPESYEVPVDAIVKEPACEPPPRNDNASADIQMVDILKVTGQLADSSVGHDLSSVCGDCGSLADSEDVFCITCGGPLEEVERTAPPSCCDCGLMIVSDEIFCPSCGSAIQDENSALF